MVDLLSHSSFTQLVYDALRNYQSTLALSRSALANLPLVAPMLVKDEASPTAEERAYGLRLVLRWAVNLLAPDTPTYPLGELRPFDDPTWQDPRWWRYNILRHRYLEPLHPDDFVGGGRYTESLLALTGINSADTLFDERQRAIRAVAEWLRQQWIEGQANAELQHLALQEAVLPLEKQGEAARLLGVAATFDDIFPRSLLLEMAAQERLSHPVRALDTLIAQRFLLIGDNGASLWLSPVLRAYVYARESRADRPPRHRWVASYYERQGDVLRAARHWQHAEQDARAVRILLPAVDALMHDLQGKELINLLAQMEASRLENGQWYAVQLLLSDLYQRSGQSEAALTACRRALQASADHTEQARVYRRMGKLYESRNQMHALRYYQQALDRFAPSDPELAELLKDRGWLYYFRSEWAKAEGDLKRALAIAPADAKNLRSDIYDVLASLYRQTGDYDNALDYAGQVLALREEAGDLLRVAKSHTNLGMLYATMGEHRQAIAAHKEALLTYQAIGNQELVAVSLINIGVAHHLDDKLDVAIDVYRQSLALCQAMDLPFIENRAHYNLAEALAAAHQPQEAASHWQAGYQLCQQHKFDDEAKDFLELGKTIPLLLDAGVIALSASDAPVAASPPTRLDADEEFVLALARHEHSVTPKRLMQAANISRATATRRLTVLVAKGWLTACGQGRGTYYVLTEGLALPDVQSSARSAAPGDRSIRAVLGKEQPRLAEHYAVVALGLAPSAPTAHYAKVIVRFAQLPDLENYLNLKHHLADILQMEVDLLPEFVAAQTPMSTTVEWIWAALVPIAPT
jgi:tetratricopeptide (TPR) repeat protein